jgi:ferrochelatase
MAAEHVLLVGHGTVDHLDELPEFLLRIRHGRTVPDELLREIRRRYEAIGGSPLLTISSELARKLEAELRRPVHLAMRFSAPRLQDALEQATRAGARVLDVVPLAPFSAHLYAAEVKRAVDEGRMPLELRCAGNWGSAPLLVDAFAAALAETLADVDASRRDSAQVLFTAHSLPAAVVQKGDRYPSEVEHAAQAVAHRARLANRWHVVYQSQGASSERWLGPDLREGFALAKQEGARDVVLCPIGFLSDHVEILYDLDIEARQWADAVGLRMRRTRSLNADEPLVHALVEVTRRCATSSELGV